MYDLFLFLGQSNMAGRGDKLKSPALIDGAGFEFRAITDPTKLYPISEPFGKDENKANGINDESKKTGSLVTSFVNTLYKRTNVPIVGVSASKGGSCISQWQIDSKEGYLKDAIERLEKAKEFLNGSIRHIYTLFLQGESDGDKNTSEEIYIKDFNSMYSHLKNHGVEKLFLIEIGRCNIKDQEHRYDEIRNAQRKLDDVVIVSSILIGEEMKDEFHFFQESYNKVGHDAALNIPSSYL